MIADHVFYLSARPLPLTQNVQILRIEHLEVLLLYLFLSFDETKLYSDLLSDRG